MVNLNKDLKTYNQKCKQCYFDYFPSRVRSIGKRITLHTSSLNCWPAGNSTLVFFGFGTRRAITNEPVLCKLGPVFACLLLFPFGFKRHKLTAKTIITKFSLTLKIANGKKVGTRFIQLFINSNNSCTS